MRGRSAGLGLAPSTDVVEGLSRLTRSSAVPRLSVEGRGDLSPGMWIEGRISFFCFEAGRISSRSTGTPSETRKRRRIRERTQSGGCRGGGATSCVQSEWLRSEWKMERVSSVEMLGRSWGVWYISSM